MVERIGRAGSLIHSQSALISCLVKTHNQLLSRVNQLLMGKSKNCSLF